MEYPLCVDKYQNAMRDLQRVRVQVRDQIINYVVLFLCMDFHSQAFQTLLTMSHEL